MFVEPFPPTGDRSQLTTRPGDNPHHPVWSTDGQRLFYIPRFSEFEYVPFSAVPAPSFGTPVAIYRAFPSAAPTEPRTFDIGPGDRILSAAAGTRNATPDGGDGLRIVINWFDELKAKVAAR